MAADRSADAHDRRPLPPRAARDALAAAAAAVPGATLVPSVPALGAELERAVASVSQCGYNTALELIQARTPALVVPYATAEEDEQRRRASRLAALGVLRVLAPEQLAPETLAREILALDDFVLAPAALDVDGARATTELLWARCAAGGPGRMSPAAQALRPFVARQWRALAGAGGATAALTAADLAKPWPLALIVDRLLDGRTAPFALERADVRLLAVVAALVLAIALVESAAQYFADLRLQVAGERIAHELRISVYDQLQRLSLGFHQRRQKGDLLTRVTSDVNAMGDLFAQSLGQITQAALLSAGMIAVLLWLDPVLALVAVATRRRWRQ